MPCVLKFLTPEALAAAVIGKGGQVIAQMRQQTQAKLGLTDHSDFFPGTDSRVLTAQAGSMEALMQVTQQIIAKLDECAQACPSEPVGGPGELKLRVLVPRAAVGSIIGKGGANVKQLRESSGAKIFITDATGSGPGAEQIVAITGPTSALEYVMSEVNTQIQALCEEPWFQTWATATTAGALTMGGEKGYGKGSGKNGGGYRGGGGGYGSPGVDLMLSVAQGLPGYVMEDSRGFALSCVVPNKLVGGIIGRGGSGTKEVQSLTGTKIGIREIPGDPDNRSMNIAGPLSNACAAYMLMMKRYLDSEASSSQAGPGA